MERSKNRPINKNHFVFLRSICFGKEKQIVANGH